MENDKKSIMKEALTDYKEIMEAADANAKKKLAEEFPEKFNNLLKEEINKNKKSVKESYKKLDDEKESEESDDAEDKKESVMKNQKEETKKVVETAGKDGVFTVPAKKVAKVEEDVTIKDTVKRNAGPFTDKAKGVKKIDEEREKDFVADVEAKTPNQGKGELQKGIAFKEKIKGPSSGKPMPNLTEEFQDFDATELDVDGVDNAIGGADEMDEMLTMEDIEREIYEMDNLGGELPASGGNTALDQLMEMRNQLDGMIQGMGEQKNNGGQGANSVNLGGPTNSMIDELGEQKNNGGQGANRVNLGGPTNPMIDEMPVAEMHQGNFPLEKMHSGDYDSSLIDEVTEEDIEAVIGSQETEEPVEEAHGVAYPTRRNATGRHTPGNDYLSQGEKDQSPYLVGEAKKRIAALINENKNLTKKLNESKKYKTTAGTLLENYKTALDKYRTQLKEMAVFNTNLAHVNNLLVNEELALTQDDKIKIINEFKSVDSIADSQKKYKAVLTEMKVGKKTLTESVEAKVTVSVQPSSKQKLDEVTAYKNDAHINKMRKLIETIEARDKKIIR